MGFNFNYDRIVIAERAIDCSETNLSTVNGIVLVNIPSHFDLTNEEVFEKIYDINKEAKDRGVHYFIDGATESEIYTFIDEKFGVEFLRGTATYISTALFSTPTNSVIYVYVPATSVDPTGALIESEDPDRKTPAPIAECYYEELDKKLIKLVVELLRKHNLTAKDVWRGFDLDSQDYSPLHLLDKKVFERYITEIEKFIPVATSKLTDDVKGNPKKFIECIAPGAVKGQLEYGVKASLTIAQAALESGWGKSGIGNNLFGIKAGSKWTGKTQLVWTHEEVNGQRIKIQAVFRDYDSIDDSVKDHALLLTADRYKPVLAASNYREACEQVQKCGYATDSKYASSLIKLIEKYNLDVYDAMSTVPPGGTSDDKVEVDDSTISIDSPIKASAIEAGYAEKSVNDFVIDIYDKHKDNPANYAKDFTPWDKEHPRVIKSEGSPGAIQTRETPYGNTLTFQINKGADPGASHCARGADSIEAVEDAEDTMVEPIYPDLITPPGDSVTIADGHSETAVQSNSNVALTPEEFERRQKVFSVKDYSNMSKDTKGRPVNVEDPFPVDDQIKKLQEHFPKVKIDKTTFNFKDTNHPDSEIGNAMAKNLAMSYDMVMEVAKRTEQRLVKIENNLSTVMRNLFRLSSRVNINCVYYGGQSIYGKYRCIRCLHDDRINDGAVVTMDQCMCCTRYEPVLGQVYAILDETGSNIVQVLDDMQMSYMGLDEYQALTSTDEYHVSKANAQVNNHPEKLPTPFIEEKWKDDEEEANLKEEAATKVEDAKESYPPDEENESVTNSNVSISDEEEKDEIGELEQEEVMPANGFKMDWNPVKLETQSPHVNEYEIEELKADKKAVSSSNEGVDRKAYEDTRADAIEYEELTFDVSNYSFSDFGTLFTSNTNGEPGNFGMGAAEARQKIVDYALQAVELCAQGKAKYSQEKRYNHLDKAIGGISYWDCSSLTQRAYEAAGITGIGTNTSSQYPYCTDKQGGLLIPLSDINQALPGDLVWFAPQKFPTTREGLQIKPAGIHHVAIYIGNNQYAHASSAKSNPNIKISTFGKYNHEMCFGRPRKLIELDEKASIGATGHEYWDKAKQGISDEVWNTVENKMKGRAEKTVENMKKYNYRDALIQASKEHGFDPYLVLSIAAVESNGDPRVPNSGRYNGIMQCSDGSWVSGDNVNDIKKEFEKGLTILNAKIPRLKKAGWDGKNLGILMNAYNCGEGAACGAFKYGNISVANATIGEAMPVVESYIQAKYPSWGASEKKLYPAKVLYCYSYFYNNKVLE